MTFEELQTRVGEEIGLSGWFAMDQARIDSFADTTEDHQFIHLDPERAKDTPFGQTIAHGFLTLSMLPPLLTTSVEKPPVKMSVNYGLDRVRFLSPVLSGKRIRGRFRLKGLVERKPGEWLQTVECTVEIEDAEKPALLADWIFLHYV